MRQTLDHVIGNILTGILLEPSDTNEKNVILSQTHTNTQMSGQASEVLIINFMNSICLDYVLLFMHDVTTGWKQLVKMYVFALSRKIISRRVCFVKSMESFDVFVLYAFLYFIANKPSIDSAFF